MTTAARTITSVGDWLDPEYKRHAVDLLSALPLKRAEQPRRRRRLVSAILLRLAQINVAPVLSVLPQTGYQDATAVRRHARDRQHWSLSGLTGGLQQIAVAVESADPADPAAADSLQILLHAPSPGWTRVGIPSAIYSGNHLSGWPMPCQYLLLNCGSAKNLAAAVRTFDWIASQAPGETVDIVLYKRAVADLVRDVLLPPRRLVGAAEWHKKMPAAWRTDTVLSLARTMSDARDFSAMPILADALQDAGCNHPVVLDHCRSASRPHCRGCWVLTELLEPGTLHRRRRVDRRTPVDV